MIQKDGVSGIQSYSKMNKMNKITKLVENSVKAFLKEYTDHDFSGAKVIADAMQKKPDSEDMEWIIEHFPNAVKSMSTAQANLKASDASPIKKRMGQYAPMFVHVQYHTIEGDAGQMFSVHQTQYYNSNFKDKPGGEKFNPRVTELYFSQKDPDEKMGVILAVTDEYIKDLRELERQGKLGKRISESLNEGKGLDTASKLIKQLREKVYRNLNDQELEEFTKEMMDHLGGTINENKFYVTRNKGRGQGKDLVKDYDQIANKTTDKPREFDSYEDAQKYVDDTQRGGSMAGQMTAYYVSDENMEMVKKNENKLNENEIQNLDDLLDKFQDSDYAPSNSSLKDLENFIDFIRDLVSFDPNSSISHMKVTETKMKTKTESIINKLKEDTEYQKFFKSAMDKFGVKSPKDLSDKKKKEFFNYVDKNYKAKNES